MGLHQGYHLQGHVFFSKFISLSSCTVSPPNPFLLESFSLRVPSTTEFFPQILLGRLLLILQASTFVTFSEKPSAISPRPPFKMSYFSPSCILSHQTLYSSHGSLPEMIYWCLPANCLSLLEYKPLVGWGSFCINCC